MRLSFATPKPICHTCCRVVRGLRSWQITAPCLPNSKTRDTACSTGDRRPECGLAPCSGAMELRHCDAAGVAARGMVQAASHTRMCLEARMRSASASTSPAPARLSDSSATPPSTSPLSRAAVENLCSGLMRCSSALRVPPGRHRQGLPACGWLCQSGMQLLYPAGLP